MRDPFLKEKIAKLLNTKAEALSLAAVETGLTHLTYKCSDKAGTYFVKQYHPASNINVEDINRLTQQMRLHGIPAPKVLAYSPEFPKLVIHEYVEGSHPTGNPKELTAIAQLYSQLTIIGLEKKAQIDRTEYLQQIEAVKVKFSQFGNDRIACQALHAQYLATLDRVTGLLDQLIETTTVIHIPTHDDFTENNLLMKNNQVALLCDWDSYRLKGLSEHLSCSAMRSSCEHNLGGNVEKNKLQYFYRNLDTKVFSNLDELHSISKQLPVFATLKHLRTYGFRNYIVKSRRPDLEDALLRQPLQHCQWLLENRSLLNDWIATGSN